MDINLTKNSSLLLHAIHSLSTRKSDSTLVLKILTKKICETRKLESFREWHLVKRKNEGRKPDKNSSLRRLEFVPGLKMLFKNSISVADG